MTDTSWIYLVTYKYRTLFSEISKCVFFSRADRTFFRIGSMLVDKISLNKFSKIEIIQNVFLIMKE